VTFIGFILSGAAAALFYYIFSLIWPVPIYPPGPHEDTPKTFEYMRPSEGYFDEDERIGGDFVLGIDAEAGTGASTSAAALSALTEKS
jgi:hypothetical protein